MSPRPDSSRNTDLEHWEGTEPSLNVAGVEKIVIGKIEAKVGRSPSSNPRFLGPARCPFVMHLA